MKYSKFATACLFTCGTLALAAPPGAIGIVTAPSEFRVNRSTVPGSATLFDGSVVETGASRSSVRLSTGARVLLASNSTAQFGRDRVILERGLAELNSSTGVYGAKAKDLTVSPVGAGARVTVGIDGSNKLRVAALEGSAEVRNSQGVLVAKAMPGMALQLESASSELTRVVGVLKSTKGGFLLKDEVTNVLVQVRGANLQSMVGSRVIINGAAVVGETPIAGATQIIAVTSATKAAAAAAAVGAGSTATGLATNSAVIIGGVATSAATVGTLYATDVIGSDEERPVSR